MFQRCIIEDALHWVVAEIGGSYRKLQSHVGGGQEELGAFAQRGDTSHGIALRTPLSGSSVIAVMETLVNRWRSAAPTYQHSWGTVVLDGVCINTSSGPQERKKVEHIDCLIEAALLQSIRYIPFRPTASIVRRTWPA